MMQAKLVSVIIPVYNCEEYLNECIDSLLCQSYPNIEIILVNDGSKDGSAEICNAYGNLRPNIHVYHQNNQGAAAARKTGLTQASGDYFLFVDADDWVEPDFVQNLVLPALESGADIVSGCLTYSTPEGKSVWKQHLPCGFYGRNQLEQTIFPTMLSAAPYYTAGVSPNMCGKLFKREIALNNISTLDTGLLLGEDGYFTYACLLDCRSICIVSEAEYIYRQNASSATQKFNPKLLEEGTRLKALYGKLSAEKQWESAHQLDEYMAYISSGVVVKMLKAPGIPYREKKQQLSDYVNAVFPHGILRRLDSKNLSLKNKSKLFLVQHRLFFLLWVIIKLNSIKTS